ncbi:MAG: hypothetical protein KJP12_05110 [Acidimicrobiia bacterium]|nr:hypothetical protein [Acidimicrobiia bacterium]
MKRALGAAIVVIVMLVGAPLGATPRDDAGNHKVTVCHATSSNTNPWVVITVDIASTQERAHQKHVHKKQDAPNVRYDIIGVPADTEPEDCPGFVIG